MKTYTVIAGDTFELISRKSYGVETEASLIQSANPGLSEPLSPGAVITIPDQPDSDPISPPDAAAENLDEVAISINGKRFRFWTKVTIRTALDSLATVELEAPFEVDNPGFREAFRPLSYAPVTVTVGGGRLFTGTMLFTPPALAPESRTVLVPAYAIPGVLNDCTMPGSAYPVEWSGFDLFGIAKEVCAPFGVTVEGDGDPGATFDFVAVSTKKKVFSFLADLAKQRNFVLSNTEDGKLLIQQSVAAGAPVAQLAQGMPALLNVTPVFRPQEYYSHVTGTLPVVLGFGGSQFTVENPRLKGIIRPITFVVPDIAEVGVQEAVEARASRMFANTVSYTIDVVGWRDRQANLWAPNTTLKLLAPGAMIYNEYEFLIRAVTFRADKKSRTASLELVLPGAFAGKIPEFLPWDG